MAVDELSVLINRFCARETRPPFVSPSFPSRPRAPDDAIDENRFDDMAAMLTPGAKMIYANLPPILGRDAIRNLFLSVAATRKSAKHRDYTFYPHPGNPDEFMVTCMYDQVIPTPLGDKTVSLPAAVRFATEGGLLSLYEIFMDPTPGTIAQGKAVVPDEKLDPKVVDHKV
ncbi:hypothetical protein DFJ74DRAFT_115702 [Hyaloraphidium curvatum]|nr:hypothetical protein DFJ74DRAFT_115702 [Hyaloraphidium curvatum]